MCIFFDDSAYVFVCVKYISRIATARDTHQQHPLDDTHKHTHTHTHSRGGTMQVTPVQHGSYTHDTHTCTRRSWCTTTTAAAVQHTPSQRTTAAAATPVSRCDMSSGTVLVTSATSDHTFAYTRSQRCCSSTSWSVRWCTHTTTHTTHDNRL